MAVHECISPKFMDNDDDDGPVVFKRNTPSKQAQFNSSLKSPSQAAGQSAGKAVSQQLPNGENTYSRRNKNIPSSSPETVKSSSSNRVNQISTPETSKNLPQKQPHPSMNVHNFHTEAANADDSDDGKPLSFRRSASEVKPTGSLPLSQHKREADSSDSSEDDKPLSYRLAATISGAQRNNSVHAQKTFNPQRSPPNLTQKFKDVSANKQVSNLEEQKSSSKLSVKPNIRPGSTEVSDSDEDKPLVYKLKQNGSCKSEPGTSGKSSIDTKKRPPIDSSNHTLSSNKKAKLSEASRDATKKDTVVKEEIKANNDEEEDDDDYVPISQRLKKTVPPKTDSSAKKPLKKVKAAAFKKQNKQSKKNSKQFKNWKPSKVPPGSGEGQKWTTLEHNGVIFPPPYQAHGVKMLYNGQPVNLTPEQEEVATMFAVMKDTDYATKNAFIENFMNDWRKILGKDHVIKKFELCDFTPIYEWHLKEKEKKKQMTTEEKKAAKEEKLQKEEKYMWAIVDGVKEKVGNFRVEPPGLFRGRGEHPKMGKLKKRIRPQDITINIGKNAPIPECPIPGERWKEVRHDNTVTWLAYWNDPINSKEFKYVFLAASSSLKGQSDKEKYEKARKLKDYIESIRARYTKDFTSKDETKRQIAVATYLIDKLALRAGNEKDDDEADTVGCCTLKVENVTLVPPNKLQFDFLGKDSIRYFNTVEVELPVYRAIGDFQKGGKDGTDDLFDKLDTAKLNLHLKELMPGLTAKVFRTYNASITLDEMLNRETKDGNVPEKIAVYQSANKEVAIICNHQRSVSKNHDTQMSRLNEKIDDLKSQQEELKIDLSRARKGKPPLKDSDGKPKRNLAPEAIEKKLSQMAARIEKMELDKKIKEDLKTVALGTSKINYLDPRISVAWCKRHEVPIEKIFNKSLLAKFSWAMDVDPSFRF